MKKSLQKVKSRYLPEISLSRANGFEGIMFPIGNEMSTIDIIDVEDEDTLLEIAEDYGWDQFIIVNFLTKKDKFIDIYELEAA